MKIKFLFLVVCLFIVYGLSGCTFSEVIKDILSVNDANVAKKTGPKVEIDDPVTLEDSARSEAEDKPEPEEVEEPTPEETKEPENIVYCLSPVNVREGGGNSYSVIGALTAGEAVEKLGQEGSWVKISYKGSVGWVYEKYLSTSD